MTEPVRAADPALNASVLASAGTGKTWLLTARLVRLLLAGARPDRILAITFTRKAAGEMQQRLNDKLRELLEADEDTLDKLLHAIGEQPTDASRRRARQLFEELLFSELPLRTTTFHSFCQELLQRFPQEADLPPGFELADSTGLLMQEAWDALFADATERPDSELAGWLDTLFDACDGLHNCRQALMTFLEHRSDWWAFTQGERDPAAHALAWLQDWLDIDTDTDPAAAFWNEDHKQALAEFAALLDKHPTKANTAHSLLIREALQAPQDAAMDRLATAFFTNDGGRRKRKSGKTQQSKMGVDGEARFLQLHDALCEALEAWREQRARLHTLRLSGAWYRAGERLLQHFQRIKRERRLLDFADLEWKTYRLLNDAEQAHWVQYKLDQRIDHLLIDEFQDTNPTQWRLVLPLLQELAAGGERARSLFLVGDAKQSIYRFRRGNPALLGAAADWMQQHLDARCFRLDKSWRSAPAILDCVNRIFTQSELAGLLADFQPHDTHRDTLWGRVELWPLFDDPEGFDPHEPATEGLRNPLHTPRLVHTGRRHFREGRAIAERIQTMIEERTPVGTAGEARTVDYNDFIILLRSRTHLADYEAALRERGIPYLSMDRGTLLQSLEVRDLEALLRLLMAPQDNLALAQVLRSPIFSATNEHLQMLARGPRGPWIDRLTALADSLSDDHPLAQAQRLLAGWRELAGRIPIHDLLDRIFHEANLLERYQADAAPGQVPRIRANLVRFIELALEVDAGRYPSLPHFLARLRQLRGLDQDAPDQAPPENDGGQRVRIMTIHAAKGLEAPVVFLADSASGPNNKRAFQALVRWPAEADRPSHMLLTGRSAELDGTSRALLEREQQDEARESANLLYVALTRARQMLFISGCAPSRGNQTGWYGQIEQALRAGEDTTGIWQHERNRPPQIAARPQPDRTTTPDPRLSRTLSLKPQWLEIAPSHAADEDDAPLGGGGGTLRGRAIHRMLQLASEANGSREGIARRVARELALPEDAPELAAWWMETEAVLADAALRWLFDGAAQAFNEIPVEYLDGRVTVYGIVDRLVVGDSEVRLVDYKTHRVTDEAGLQRLAEHYRRQIALYREAVTRLWPRHRVRAFVLFTHARRLLEIEARSP